jgi:HlyD family secretion protein
MSTSIVTRYGLPVIAIGLLVFAVVSTVRPERGRTEPVLTPTAAPFQSAVAGVGVVEPMSEMIAIATELPGVAREVFVVPGQTVRVDAPLFRLDDRAQRAALAQAAAGQEMARAALAAAEVALADERQRLQLFEAVADPRAVSIDEVSRRRFGVDRAAAALKQARAGLRAADAQVAAVQTELDRLTIRAPITGRVFSVDIRPGEFAAAGPAQTPLMTLGSAEKLHVRVEIDETDMPRVVDGATASGTLRGRADRRIPLTFVRFEPQAVEKRALAGGAERVASRVIEAIYAFEPAGTPAFVGQRMDVYIEAPPLVRQAERRS